MGFVDRGMNLSYNEKSNLVYTSRGSRWKIKGGDGAWPQKTEENS